MAADTGDMTVTVAPDGAFSSLFLPRKRSAKKGVRRTYWSKGGGMAEELPATLFRLLDIARER